MKFRDFTNHVPRTCRWLALATLCAVTAASEAQELFRVGRPAYARASRALATNASPTYSLTPNRSTPLPLTAPPLIESANGNCQPFQALESTVPYQSGAAYVRDSTWQNVSMPDYERVQLAWENYQREVSSYRARYGREATPRRPRDAWRGPPNEPFDNVLPTGLTDGRATPLAGESPNGGVCPGGARCRTNGFDVTPADLPPQLSREVPVRPYRESATRDLRRSLANESDVYDSAQRTSERRRLVPVPKSSAASGFVRQRYEPASPPRRERGDLNQWAPAEFTDSEMRHRQDTPYLNPRKSAKHFEPTQRDSQQRFGTPTPRQPPATQPPAIQMIDPAKIASRARDFFYSHLSE